jgi:hypothetical protein
MLASDSLTFFNEEVFQRRSESNAGDSKNFSQDLKEELGFKGKRDEREEDNFEIFQHYLVLITA